MSWAHMRGREQTPEHRAMDHVIPTSRGGPDTDENKVPCCFSCNASKGNRTPGEWINGD